MYCKLYQPSYVIQLIVVLIVAKCIVNLEVARNIYDKKYVLIVAKCIVNYLYLVLDFFCHNVLIVAKCIVNGQVHNGTGQVREY